MEEYKRFIKLIGEEKFREISSKTVLVVGVGGVGSYAVESLARSGIGHIILLDYDTVDISNINRQIPALHTTIGMKKIDVLKKRIEDINPLIKTTLIGEFLTSENMHLLDALAIDYIVDACDTVTTKFELIKYATKNNIKIISSMGTGNKFDPTKLEIIDIRKTEYDPLAKVMRKLLKDNHINEKIMVISSKEKPIKLNDRTPGSTAFVPSTAGLLCTSYIINDILKQ